jgi:hypothetical protein
LLTTLAHGDADRPGIVIVAKHLSARWRFDFLASFEALGMRWQTGRTLEELAELELARSNPSQARDHYLRAIAAFEQLKCGPDLERARSALDVVQPGHD